LPKKTGHVRRHIPELGFDRIAGSEQGQSGESTSQNQLARRQVCPGDTSRLALRITMRTFSVYAVLLLLLTGCGENPKIRKMQAQSQVDRLADDLDQRTDQAGVYQRVKPDEIQETDPWNEKLQVSYSQGGIAEIVRVRSAGPDRSFDTRDDIVAQRMSANWKGVRQGIKDDAEEVAANAAKGAVRGGVEGIKESVKEALKKKSDSGR
jgi:hypothetical protein